MGGCQPWGVHWEECLAPFLRLGFLTGKTGITSAPDLKVPGRRGCGQGRTPRKSGLKVSYAVVTGPQTWASLLSRARGGPSEGRL